MKPHYAHIGVVETLPRPDCSFVWEPFEMPLSIHAPSRLGRFALITLILFTVFGGFTLNASSIHAQTTPTTPEPPSFEPFSPFVATSDLAILQAEAAASGTVRVIVGLNVNANPRGRLTADAITSAQNSLLSTLAVSGAFARPERQFDFIPYMALTVDAAALDTLSRSPLVTSMSSDALSAPDLNSTMPIIGVGGAGGAWEMGYTGSGWAVAVLDTGVDKNHPSLAGQVISEACYNSNTGVSSTRCPGGATSSTASGSGMDCAASLGSGCEHGTHVAGIVASTDGYFRGVAPAAKIIAINVFSYFPTYCSGAPCVLTYDSDQLAGMQRVYDLRGTHNIAAVNMSLGSTTKYTSESACDSANPGRKAAIDQLRAVGIATVISAGNSGFVDGMGAPGCISTSISVGAIDDSRSVWFYSNAASFTDLFAPGVSVTSAKPFQNNFQTYSGTSMAAPHVAGAFALMRQAKPDATVTEIRDTLVNTGYPVTDTRSGAGGRVKPLIQVNSAITAILPTGPDAPAEIIAIPDGFNRVDVAWDNVTDEYGYYVQWSYAGNGGWTTFATTAANVVDAAQDTLSCGTTRHYRVLAFNGAGNSTPSPTTSATTAACPASPQTVLLVNGNFEDNDEAPAKIPDGWTGVGTLLGDKVRADGLQIFSYSAVNSFKLMGNPDEVSNINQTLNLAGANIGVGDTLLLRAMVDQRTGIGKTAFVKVIITYSDNKKQNLQLKLPNNATAGYVPLAVSLTLTRTDITSIKVQVMYNQPSGLLYVDNVQFGLIDGAGALAVTSRDGDKKGGLVPLPAAPKDLRGN